MARPDRYHVDIPVDCSTRDLFTANRVTNLSRGGLFIQSSDPLPLQAEVDLTFTLPDGPRIQATGRVIWNYDIAKANARIVPGSGIKFTGMSPEDRRRLDDCIRRLAEAPRPSTVEDPSQALGSGR